MTPVPTEYPAAWPDAPMAQAALRVVKTLRRNGFQAAPVGGAVRDLLSGRTPADIDLVTTARPEEVGKLFPDSQLVGAAFGVALVRSEGHEFEVASARLERNYLDGRHPESVVYTDSTADDVLRRDFTINALLYDCDSGKIVDFVGGVADFNRGILRTVGAPEVRFREDYLRMLRAVRFAARLNFTLDAATADAIRALAALTAELAPERVGDELTRMLTGPRPDRAVELLAETGLLATLMPEIAAMAGVEQPVKYHPEGDVYRHTLAMLRHLVAPTPELAWSVLLHDVGKPAAFSRDADGTPHFYNHERIGEPIARALLARLRFSNDRIERVVRAVGGHMVFGLVSREAKLRRVMASPDFALELELNRLDAISSRQYSEQFVRLLDRRIADAGRVELPTPLLNGRDLIAAGLTPGPSFKELLEQLYDLQLEGVLRDRDDALKRLRKLAGNVKRS